MAFPGNNKIPPLNTNTKTPGLGPRSPQPRPQLAQPNKTVPPVSSAVPSSIGVSPLPLSSSAKMNKVMAPSPMMPSTPMMPSMQPSAVPSYAMMPQQTVPQLSQQSLLSYALAQQAQMPSYIPTQKMLPETPPEPGAETPPDTAAEVKKKKKKKERKGKKITCCGVLKKIVTKPWTIFFLSAIALSFYFHFHMHQVFFHEKMKNEFGKVIDIGFGIPATEYSAQAATNFESSYYLIGLLGFLGFFIIQGEITNMFLGLLYMFGLSVGLYFSCSALSNSIYASSHDTFYDVYNYTKHYYNDPGTHGEIPGFINAYQQKRKCCGWGKIFTKSWSEIKVTNDKSVPDSCCVHQSKGCGTNIFTDEPSGFISYVLNHNETNPPAFCIDQLKNLRPHSNIAFNHNFVRLWPKDYLRDIDFQYYPIAYEIKNPIPCIIISYGRAPVFYFSYGPEELKRLEGVIFQKSCDVGPPSKRRLKPPSRHNMTHEDFKKYTLYGKDPDKHVEKQGFTYWIRRKTKELVMPASVLSANCFLMAFLFMYSFSKINHKKHIQKQKEEQNSSNASQFPREFTDYDVEGKDEESDEEVLQAAVEVIAADLELKRLEEEKKKALGHAEQHRRTTHHASAIHKESTSARPFKMGRSTVADNKYRKPSKRPTIF